VQYTDWKEGKQLGQDFISRLPDEILHAILFRLQIRDAAVITAVSKRRAQLFPKQVELTNLGY
jgi:hypothetical protein